VITKRRRAPTSAEAAPGHGRLRSAFGRRGHVATFSALALIAAVALSLRIAGYVENPRPIDGGGIVAEQAEMARNAVDHGRWFALNRPAFEFVKARQVEQGRLVDFSQIDFSRFDRQTRAEPVVDQMPGVSVVLAALWWPSGDKTYASIQWLQILLDTAMVILIFWIGLRLTRSRLVAFIAASGYAIWPGAIVVAKRPMPDTWAGFFSIGCVAAFVWARERPASRARLALLGVVTGLGIYFRPFVVLLPIALALVATPGGGWRRRLFWLSAPTVIALLLLAPWTVRNYVEFHRFIPTRTGLGQAVFEGIGQASNDESAARFVHGKNSNARYGSPAYDDFLLSGAARAIAEDPRRYFGYISHRARFLLPCLVGLLAWRRWRTGVLIAVATAAAIIVPYLFIGDDTRFYLPAAFAYFILGAMAVDRVLSAVRHRLLSGGGARGTSQSPSGRIS
jgi:4-amino-4-deoxy-L-arabinose transferase-like glycosyltransferase